MTTLDLSKPLKTIAEGKAFIEALHAEGKMFHFEDSPYDIIRTDGRQLFTPRQCEQLEHRVSELYGMDWVAEGTECPIGYALKIMEA